MTMMLGNSPFGSQKSGEFNFQKEGPENVLYLEPCLKKICAVVDGKTVADSANVKLLHETGHLPKYYFPIEDVNQNILEETERHTKCELKGTASYFSIKTKNGIRKNAAWTYPDPIESCPPIEEHLAFYWKKIDEWWEEAERVFGHARDPYHRLEPINTDRHVVIKIEDTVIADTNQATMLFETGLPPRFYIPEIDVKTGYLQPSDTETRCPYKGLTSRYYTAKIEDKTLEDLVWVYDQPLDEVRKIAGKLAFYNKRVDLVVDGQSF